VRRARVLVAPVTVTPTKPLTLSHLKALLWQDVLVRATAQVADVTVRYSQTSFHLTAQTLGFWEYLDRVHGDTDYDAVSEDDIGERYMCYQAEPQRVPYARLRPYAEAVESTGWTHPVSDRLLRLWVGQYARFGLHDPGLLRVRLPGMPLEQLVDLLSGYGLCLDTRRHGGPVYLDATARGLPLRPIIAADGQPNYLACALRDLLPLVDSHDTVVLGHDLELQADYQLLTAVLERLGVGTHRIGVGRVPVDGVVRSARHGDWRGRTASAVVDACAVVDARADAPDPAAVRLGLRLYFIATLGAGQQQSFRPELLSHAVRRAGSLLADARRVEEHDLQEFLCGQRGRRPYVDPYRLTSSLLSRHRAVPVCDLIERVLS